MEPLSPFFLFGSLAMAGAAGYCVWVVLSIYSDSRALPAEVSRFELVRREKLRAGSWIYRNCEPWIDEQCVALKAKNKNLVNIGRQLTTSANPLPWEPAEFVAVNRIQSLLLAVAVTALSLIVFGPVTAAMLGGGVFWLLEYMALKNLNDRATRRRISIKGRLSAAIDLMSLIMEVGGSFQESLATIAKEAGRHPLGIELNYALKEIHGGQSRKVALENFSERLQDDDASDFVAAIVKGESLGTPLASILRTQSEQMRLRRSQLAEKAAQEAQVMLVFPGMIIMIACLIIVAAPFILSAVFADGG